MKGDYTKAKEISQETKEKVLKRQNYRSIGGEMLYGQIEFHHVRPRSASGVGYEFNIVALTPQEHRNLHDKQNIKVYGRDRYTWQEFETLCRNHLILHYNNWSYEGCKYHKYWKEKDYGIVARDS